MKSVGDGTLHDTTTYDCKPKLRRAEESSAFTSFSKVA